MSRRLLGLQIRAVSDVGPKRPVDFSVEGEATSSSSDPQNPLPQTQWALPVFVGGRLQYRSVGGKPPLAASHRLLSDAMKTPDATVAKIQPNSSGSLEEVMPARVMDDIGHDGNILSRFEVPGSRDIAARLFESVEVRRALLASERSTAAKFSARRGKTRSMPIGGKMLTRFGSERHVVALVVHLGWMTHAVADSDTHELRALCVQEALEDVFGDHNVERTQIEAIVEAVSEARARSSRRAGACGSVDVIRFLAFENVWQRLSEESRHDLTVKAADIIKGAGLVDAIKAFEVLWQDLTVAQQDIARRNLQRIAHSMR